MAMTSAAWTTSSAASWIAEPSHGEAEQARKIPVEEHVERALVAGSHALNELGVIHGFRL